MLSVFVAYFELYLMLGIIITGGLDPYFEVKEGK